MEGHLAASPRDVDRTVETLRSRLDEVGGLLYSRWQQKRPASTVPPA